MKHPSIRIEGGTLSADVLDKIEQGDVSGQKPADFGLSAEAKVKDEIVRAWADAQDYWRIFRRKLDALPPTATATTETRNLWAVPLLGLLGYQLEYSNRGEQLDGKIYPISHRLPARDGFPVHVIGYRDSLDRKRADGGPRMSPHGLIQEYLNLTEHLYAIVTNGRQLRLLRDSSRLVRLSFVEFDLARIFEEQLFSDFALLYRLLHVTRLPRTRESGAQSFLERYHQDALDSGARIRDGLRDAVEDSLISLANGFLSHPRNHLLQAAITNGELTERAFYQHVLRLIYRLLFLMVVEERRLIFPRGVERKHISLYFDYYSLQRLRRLAAQRFARDRRHEDHWTSLRSTFALFEENGPGEKLGISPLAGQLFSSAALGLLATANLDNATLLRVIDRLCTFEHPQTHQRTAVNYGALATEEFGSVYESLLESHPVIHRDPSLRFSFKEAAGNERKTTGSYYTPSSLVECLLDSALDPVLDERLAGKKGAEAEEAILLLKVCDPACGSGHFLIAAAQRIARRLATLRAGDEEPSPDQLRHALRQVIGRCLYGVDINPMAVELCKVTLWLEATEPGKPLSFLDHHIQCGNSLLGVTPRLLEEGLPDDAFKPIAGDDKAVCTEAKKRNKEERKQLALFHGSTEIAPWLHLGNLPAAMLAVDTMSDDTAAELHRKEERYAALVRSAAYESARFLADAWCAAFVWKKTRDFGYPITNDVLRKIERNPHGACDPWMRDEIERLREQYQFFHWHLAFPEVFPPPAKAEKAENKNTGWSGGFDVLLGNPPWDRLKLDEQEWFAERAPEIANAPTTATRKRLLSELPERAPALWRQFENARRVFEGINVFIRISGNYPHGAGGELNLATLFAETFTRLANKQGRVGAVLPTTIVTDKSAQPLCHAWLEKGRLVAVFDFENRAKLFPHIDSRYKFAVVTLRGGEQPGAAVKAGFYLQHPEEVSREENLLSITLADIAQVNPNTLSFPVSRTKRDAELLLAMHRRAEPLLRDSDSFNGGSWGYGVFFVFEMNKDSDVFTTQPADGLLPLLEAKLVHQFNHRAATFAGQDSRDIANGNARESSPGELADGDYSARPRFWVPSADVDAAFKRGELKESWAVVAREITNATNERTVLVCFIPKVGMGHTSWTLRLTKADARQAAMLVANLNSLALDYAARQKVGGTHLSNFILKQLPAFAPATYAAPCEWARHSTSLRDWLLPRVLELTYTAWDLEPFARDCGWFGPPFIWNDERRFQLRCELDAAFFHLYGLSRDDTAYILDTFPIVRRKDEERTERLEGQPRYLTKETILSRYDELGECAATGRAFAGGLRITAADPRAAHDPRLPAVPRVALTGREYFEIILPLILSMTANGMERTRLFHAITLLTDTARRRTEAARELPDVGRQWTHAFREQYNWQDAGEALLSEIRKHRIRGVDRLRLAPDAAVTASNPWLCLDAYIVLRLALVAEPIVAQQSESAQQPWADKIIELQQAA